MTPRGYWWALLLTAMPGCREARGPVALGYSETISDGGRPFLGYYDSSRFRPLNPSPEATQDTYIAQADSILHAFQPGKVVWGHGEAGQDVRIRVDSIHPRADYYAPVLDLSIHGANKLEGAALFTSAPLSITVLKKATAAVPPELDSLLRIRAETLWARAVEELAPDDRDLRYVLRNPTAIRVEAAPGYLVVRYGMDIKWGARRLDDRGLMFFIVDHEHRIILSRFGHPEWAPVDDSIVLTVDPRIFFQIEGDPRVYFAGIHESGWEDFGWAIYDLRTGKTLLQSY